MGIPVLLICSLLAALIGTILRKYYTDQIRGRLSGIFLFNAVCSGVSALILLLWGGIGTISLFTILLGVLFGLVTTVQLVTNLKALQFGPMSYTTIIISFSTLISAVSGALFFNETMGIAHIMGIALMMVSFALAVERNAEEKRASLRWMLLCLTAFLCTGGIGIMQKVHQSSAYKDELNAFLVIAFGVSLVLSAALTVVARKKECKPLFEANNRSQTGLLVGAMLLCGGSVAVNNKLNLYLSGVMDSAVFFPIVNGVGLILATLAAILVFREKLSKKQWIGILFGIASVFFLCNPFA